MVFSANMFHWQLFVHYMILLHAVFVLSVLLCGEVIKCVLAAELLFASIYGAQFANYVP